MNFRVLWLREVGFLSVPCVSTPVARRQTPSAGPESYCSGATACRGHRATPLGDASVGRLIQTLGLSEFLSKSLTVRRLAYRVNYLNGNERKRRLSRVGMYLETAIIRSKFITTKTLLFSQVFQSFDTGRKCCF